MISPRLRPRFEMHVALPTETIIQRLSGLIESPSREVIGTKAGNHFHLNMDKKEQRLWSPHLGLDVVETTSGSLIKGHFGPRADIWTLIVAMYAICGFVAFMALIFAFSQWSLGMSTWSLWIVAIAACIGLTVYILALLGQTLSQKQMKLLLAFVEEAADDQSSN